MKWTGHSGMNSLRRKKKHPGRQALHSIRARRNHLIMHTRDGRKGFDAPPNLSWQVGPCYALLTVQNEQKQILCRKNRIRIKLGAFWRLLYTGLGGKDHDRDQHRPNLEYHARPMLPD